MGGWLVGAARAVVAVSDFGANFLREKFPEDARKIFAKSRNRKALKKAKLAKAA